MTLMLGILFGAVGSGYLLYGKRIYSAPFALTGVLLMVFPYFVANPWLTCLVGAALIATPIVMQRYA
jgi:hypothetical protein